MNGSLQRFKRGLKSTPVIVGLGCFAALLILVLPVILLMSLARAEAERELAAKRAELEAAGYLMSMEALGRHYGSLPEGENAAPVYREAYSLIDLPDEIRETLPPWGEGDWPGRGEPVPAGWEVLAVDLIERNARAIELLHEAAGIPDARFQIDFSAGWDLLIPHVSDMRSSARFLSFLIVWSANEGRWTEATAHLEALFAIAGALREEPTLIGQLTRIAVMGIGIEALEQALIRSTPPAEHWNGLRNSVERLAGEGGMTYHGLFGELALTNSALDDMELLSEFRVEVSSFDSLWKIPVYYYGGGLARDKTLYLELAVRNIEAARAPPPERRELFVTEDEIERLVAERRLPEGSITEYLLPTVSRIAEAEARMLSRFRSAEIAIAAAEYRERNGALPDTPGALVPEYLEALPADPVTGDPLVYRLEDGWLILSSPAFLNEDANWSRFRLPAER